MEILVYMQGFSAVTLEIIRFLLELGRESYLREVARGINRSSSVASRHLKLLVDNNILIERRFGRELIFKLDYGNIVTEKLIELVRVIKNE